MPDLFSSLIFVIIAGFIFNHSVPVLRYKTKNQPSSIFILSTLISGIALYVFTYIVGIELRGFCEIRNCSIVKSNFLPFVEHLYPALSSLSPEKKVFDASTINTSIAALVLSLFVWLFIGFCRVVFPTRCKNFIRSKTILKEIIERGGYKSAFLHICMRRGIPILLTLKSRKAYVGYVLNLPYMEEKEDWALKLLPLRSGYRDANTLHLLLDNDYDRIWAEIQKNFTSGFTIMNEEKIRQIRNAGVLIKWDDIETMSEWIPEIYTNLNANKPDNKAKKI